ncbi:MAG: methyl-accepting chemotaxis protein [Desulfobacter sp.]|nr:methyl-accepting chemotaxis protein [Desulfobacter sp.]
MKTPLWPSCPRCTLITTVLIGVLGGLVTLLVSHKIAGPMYRFEADIQRVARGDLKFRIQIREKDQFQDLAVSLNQMIKALHLKVLILKKEIHNIDGDGQASNRMGKLLDEHFKL